MDKPEKEGARKRSQKIASPPNHGVLTHLQPIEGRLPRERVRVMGAGEQVRAIRRRQTS